MRRLVVVVVLAGVGCSSSGELVRPGLDGDVLTFDAAMIARGDASLPASPDGSLPTPRDASIGDAGMPVDAWIAPDTGTPSGDCVLWVPRGRFGPLVPACLPRCSSATAASYRACGTQSCRNLAIDRDTTPGTTYWIGTAPVTTPLDCGGCIAYQEMHCFSLVCVSQVDSYVDECIAGIDETRCDNALYRLNDCLALLTSSQEATVTACMGSEEGLEGCFP